MLKIIAVLIISHWHKKLNGKYPFCFDSLFFLTYNKLK